MMGVIDEKYDDRKAEMALVVLQPDEVKFCREIGFQRSKSYTRDGYGTERGDSLPNVHTVGVLAEMTVAKHFGVSIDTEIIDGGDPGIDLIIQEKTVDVKANRRQSKELLVQESKTKADIYILCDIESADRIRLVGWTDRETVMDREPQYYPTDMLSYVVHWTDLNKIPEDP